MATIIYLTADTTAYTADTTELTADRTQIVIEDTVTVQVSGLARKRLKVKPPRFDRAPRRIPNIIRIRAIEPLDRLMFRSQIRQISVTSRALEETDLTSAHLEVVAQIRSWVVEQRDGSWSEVIVDWSGDDAEALETLEMLCNIAA